MQPNKYFALAFLVVFGLMNWLFFFRSACQSSSMVAGSERLRERVVESCALITLALCAMLMMLTMGWARETARAYNGYLIYGQVRLEDERSTYGDEDQRHAQTRQPRPISPPAANISGRHHSAAGPAITQLRTIDHRPQSHRVLIA